MAKIQKLTLSIVIRVMVLVLFLSYTIVNNAEATDDVGFMDLESAINALERQVDKARRSIVLIVAYDATGEESGRGSGIFIGSEGRIITNAVVIKDAYSAEVFSGSDHYNEVVVLNRKEDIDLALLQVKSTNVTPLELDLDPEVRPGERVIVVGKTSGFDTTFSEGLISSVQSIGETVDLVEIETSKSLLSYRTSKDGPVINMDGKMIGITTSVIKNPEEDDVIPRAYYGEKLNAIILGPVISLIKNQAHAERLHPPRTRVWSQWFIYMIKTAAISAFIALYNLGFPKIMAIIFAFIVLVSLIQWLYNKLIRSGK